MDINEEIIKKISSTENAYNLLINENLTLNDDTIKFLEEKNIKYKRCKVFRLRIVNYKVDCFAFEIRSGKFKCNALTEINCNNCKFYRNNTTKSKIESDVKKYIKK